MLLEKNLITPHRITNFGKGKRSTLILVQKIDEMCITTYRDNFYQAKLANQGAPGIWVGFAEVYPIGTYWVFNPKTKKIILTKDVTFLQSHMGTTVEL